jgi:pilus assembly protein CpaB
MDRQRVLMIFGIAWVSAILLTWFLWTRTKAPKTETYLKAVAAVRDMPAGTRLRKTDIKAVRIPQKDVPKAAVAEEKDALDRVLLYPVNSNELLVGTRLSSLLGAEGIPATIQPGKRAIAVPITDASGVAGLIQPHSRVDVLFSRTGALAEASTSTILQDVEVLAVGRLTQAGQIADPKAPRVPVATLLVTPEDARKLELAKNQGKISLALRNPLDRSVASDTRALTLDALDPMIFARSARARRGLPPMAGGKLPDLKDDNAWRELTGQKKEEKKPPPPKPKTVVDVFRGEKHVQEIFQ